MTDDFKKLDETEWDRIQTLIPISCVDVLPFVAPRRENDGEGRSLLLIERLVPVETGGWSTGLALIGGRVGYGERLISAATRHLEDTIDGYDWGSLPISVEEPAAIGEYFPSVDGGSSFDPRRHAVALTYLLELPSLRSDLEPKGEARRLAWRSEHELTRAEVGFRQWIPIEKALGHPLRGR